MPRRKAAHRRADDGDEEAPQHRARTFSFGAGLLEALDDRRLRRYLTWHLQRVRGETLTSAADIPMLLDSMVTVELAPVSARIDRRFDRQVTGATP
jgi:hypothetical protein